MQQLSRFNQNLKTALTPPKEPYISVNKLAEYMEANATRRRQIIKTLKEDLDFKKLYYQHAKAILPGYFKSGYDPSIIDKAIAGIEKREKRSKWEEDDCKNSIIALNALKGMELPSLDDYELVKDAPELKTVNLSGMIVGLKPEIYLRNKHSNKISAIKFHFAKTVDNRLSNVSRQHAATMLKYGFMTQDVKDKEIDNNMCLSVDVFSGDYSSAPPAYKRTLDSLIAACDEIKARWDTL